MTATARIVAYEQVIRGLIVPLKNSEGDYAEEFFIALHNAFAHGDIIPGMSEKQLNELYVHFDALIAIASGELEASRG